MNLSFEMANSLNSHRIHGFKSISMTKNIDNKQPVKKPKVLVLGGSGFVGSTFIERASKHGFDIVSLSRRGKPVVVKSNNDNKICDRDNKEKDNNRMESNDNIIWCKGDASDYNVIYKLHEQYGPFDSCVHAIGLLFDSKSGLQSINKIVSGSNSIPDNEATYDKITRLTAYNAIDSFDNYNQHYYNTKSMDSTNINNGDDNNINSNTNDTSDVTTDDKTTTSVDNLDKSFIFVSAAEAGWTFQAPVDFLERYLIAKRLVEKKLLAFNTNHATSKVSVKKNVKSTSPGYSKSSNSINNSNNNNESMDDSVNDIINNNNTLTTTNTSSNGNNITVVKLRPVIFRPSLIWTWKRPLALVSVIPFYLGSKVGLPFVDRPVTVESLVDAMIYAIEHSNVSGIMKFQDVDNMSSKTK